ncbi:hypothetical protein PHAVU_008G276400 [Phaseolus vulgaris]
MKSSMGMEWLFPLCCLFLLFHFSFSHSFCHPHDNLALLHFKASLTINNTMYTDYIYYYNNYYYYHYCDQVYPNIATWENGTDCCFCFSHLVELDLSSLGLTEFSKLRKVPVWEYLILSNNKVNGKVPNWLHEIDSLLAVNLAQNFFTTPVDQFSRNYQLRFLDLSYNLLTCDISINLQCKFT